MLGFSHGDLAGMLIWELGPFRDLVSNQTKFEELKQQGYVFCDNLPLETSAGRKIAVEFVSNVYQDGDRHVIQCTVRDITERKRMDEQIRHLNADLEGRVRERTAELMIAKELAELADRLKSEFLANMSHELRTPLNGIIGFAEFLVDGKPGQLNAKQKEYLGDILNSGRHLLQLINDVLDLAKVEAGKMELSPESFSIRNAIGEVCAVVKTIARKKGIRLEVAVASELGKVTLDQPKFKQVLYNLLSNAIKFTGDGGQVDVIAAPHGALHFSLAVKDTGIGIKPEDLKRLFCEFEQLESDVSRRYEGTGLGLALTRRIVELQGGRISAESEHGKGTTFAAILPLDASACDHDEKARGENAGL